MAKGDIATSCDRPRGKQHPNEAMIGSLPNVIRLLSLHSLAAGHRLCQAHPQECTEPATTRGANKRPVPESVRVIYTVCAAPSLVRVVGRPEHTATPFRGRMDPSPGRGLVPAVLLRHPFDILAAREPHSRPPVSRFEHLSALHIDALQALPPTPPPHRTAPSQKRVGCQFPCSHEEAGWPTPCDGPSWQEGLRRIEGRDLPATHK